MINEFGFQLWRVRLLLRCHRIITYSSSFDSVSIHAMVHSNSTLSSGFTATELKGHNCVSLPSNMLRPFFTAQPRSNILGPMAQFANSFWLKSRQLESNICSVWGGAHSSLVVSKACFPLPLAADGCAVAGIRSSASTGAWSFQNPAPKGTAEANAVLP